MNWNDIRQQYPNQWVLIEALAASSVDGKRILDTIAFIKDFNGDWRAAWAEYDRLHAENSQREFYVVHTENEILDILISRTLGSRFIA